MKRKFKGIAMAEIMVVLILILMMISLLMPALVGLQYQNRHYRCANNMKQLAFGFLYYANNNQQRLPGNCFNPITNVSDPNFTPIPQRSWLFQGVNNNYASAPFTGSLYDFTGNKAIYRCPLLATGTVNSGIGSNGLWDYGMYNSFYGARIDMIRLTTRFYPRINTTVDPVTNMSTNMNINKWVERVTPIIVEEDPFWNVNRNHLDADHSNNDCMGNWHQVNPSGKHGAHANYSSADGSVQFFEQTGDYQVAAYAWSLTPSGKVKQIGAVGPAPYALWDTTINSWPTVANANTPVW